VIFDSKKNQAAVFPRAAPNVFGIQHVPQMKPAGWSWGETRKHGVLQGSTRFVQGSVIFRMIISDSCPAAR
jgi:hypothetical protein